MLCRNDQEQHRKFKNKIVNVYLETIRNYNLLTIVKWLNSILTNFILIKISFGLKITANYFIRNFDKLEERIHLDK